MEASMEDKEEMAGFTSMFEQLMHFYGLMMPPQCSIDVPVTQHNVDYQSVSMEHPTINK